MRTLVLLVLLLPLVTACCVAGRAGDGPPLVTSFTEADERTGQVIRVQGTAQREKIGDSVDSPSLNVICVDTRFPDDRIGTPVTVEGKLEITQDFAATVGPDGEISQGTAGGVFLYVIYDCRLLYFR